MGFFYFTRGERRALVALASIGLLSLAVLGGWRELMIPLTVFHGDASGPLPPPRDASSALSSARPAQVAEMKNPVEEPPTATRAHPGRFDPNEADLDTWVAAGLSPRQARTILNYREKGGRFRKKEDLMRMYSIDSLLYLELEPWIDLPKVPREERNTLTLAIDINRASPEEWKLLPGIGAGYAGRICRFRDLLGGFTSVEQVGETRGLPDSVFQRVRPHLVESDLLRNLDINTLPADSLARHPYIDWKAARTLANYRQHHGPFRSREDLLQSRALTEAELDRLWPYLMVEQ
jgi:competence protein ComEA